MFGTAAFLLTACGAAPEAQQSQQGLFLSSATQSVCTDDDGNPPTFDVTIFEAGCVTVATDLNGDPIPTYNLGLTELIDVSELELDTTVTGTWVAGDWFQPLHAGAYCVSVTTNGGAFDPAETQVTDDVTVDPGETAEIVFAFDCGGGSISALDIVVLVNEGPSITDFFYGDSGKFVLTCEPGVMYVSWTSPQTDDITVTCTAYDGDVDGEPAGVQVGAPMVQTYESVLAGVEQTTRWSWSLDEPGTYWVYCDIENSAGQVTKFQTFLHVSSPAAGYCYVEGDGEGEVHGGYATPHYGEPFSVAFTDWTVGDADSGGPWSVYGADFVFPGMVVEQVPTDSGEVTFAVDGGFVGTVTYYMESEQNVGTIVPFTAGLTGTGSNPVAFDWNLVNTGTEAMGWTFTMDYNGTPVSITFEGLAVHTGLAGEVYFSLPGTQLTVQWNQDNSQSSSTQQVRVLPYQDFVVTDTTYAMLSCDPEDLIEVDAECAAGASATPCDPECLPEDD